MGELWTSLFIISYSHKPLMPHVSYCFSISHWDSSPWCLDQHLYSPSCQTHTSWHSVWPHDISSTDIPQLSKAAGADYWGCHPLCPMVSHKGMWAWQLQRDSVCECVFNPPRKYSTLKVLHLQPFLHSRYSERFPCFRPKCMFMEVINPKWFVIVVNMEPLVLAELGPLLPTVSLLLFKKL